MKSYASVWSFGKVSRHDRQDTHEMQVVFTDIPSQSVEEGRITTLVYEPGTENYLNNCIFNRVL
jgi:hypothetical protein